MQPTPAYDVSQDDRAPVRREGNDVVVSMSVADAILGAMLERLLLDDPYAKEFFLPLRETFSALAQMKIRRPPSFLPLEKRPGATPSPTEIRDGPEIPLGVLAELLRALLREARRGDPIAESHAAGLQGTVRHIAAALSA